MITLNGFTLKACKLYSSYSELQVFIDKNVVFMTALLLTTDFQRITAGKFLSLLELSKNGPNSLYVVVSFFQPT